jgi:hypothetical protein
MRERDRLQQVERRSVAPASLRLRHSMRRASAGHDLEARVEALRRELAALIVTLCNTGQRLEDLADELRSRRQMDNVVALHRRRHGKGGHGPDILVDFLE